MEHLTHEGRIYCDWRTSIHGCEGERFFMVTFLFAMIASYLMIAITLASFLVRKFAHGDSWRSFTIGDSRFLVITLIAGNFRSLTLLVTILNVSPLASGILWAIFQGSIMILMGSMIGTAFQLLPEGIWLQKGKGWFKSPKNLEMVGYVVPCFFTLYQVAIFSAGFSLKASDPILGARLDKAGLISTEIFTIFWCLLHIFCVRAIKMKILKVLAETRKFEKEEIDSRLLVIAQKKLNQNMIGGIINGAILVTFFGLLSFYDNFFTDLSCSMAMVIVFVLNDANGVMYAASILFLDLKKWIYAKTIKEQSSSKESKKERDDSALKSSQARPGNLSISGNVEMIISELEH